jgi:TP901 family phage tail tape measure protein
MLGIGGAISAGVGIATGVAANFEHQMDAVSASLDNTGLSAGEVETQFQQLTETALRIGKETQFSAGEAGQAMEELAKLGVDATDIIHGTADATVDLAAAVGSDLPTAAQAMGAVMNTFNPEILGMEQGIDDAASAADTLTAAVNASSVDIGQFMAGFRPLAPLMANVGGTFEETAAAVAYFSNFGLRAADVGVSLARGIENLVDPTSEAGAVLDTLGIQIKAFAEDGSFIGLPNIMDQLGESMKNLTAEEKAWALTSIFGAEAVDVMGIAALTSGDGLREMEGNMVSSGQAAASAAIRMDNFKGAMEELTGSIETALIAFGTPLLGGMRSTVEGLTEIVNAFLELSPAVQGVISRTVALTGTLLGIGGSALIAAGYFVRLAQALGLSQGAALRLVGAFGLLGALLAIAAGAYATNFLGFGDTVRRVAGNAAEALETFVDEFQNLSLLFRGTGLNKLAAGVKAFGAAFTDAFGVDIEGFTDRLSEGIQAFGDTFAALTEGGINPAVAGLFALEQALDEMDFESAANLMGNLAQSAANFGTEFKASAAEARAAGYDDLAANIIAFGDALDYVTGLPIEPAFRRVAEVVQTMQNAFDRALVNGLNPFEAGIEGLKSGLESITGVDVTQFTDNLGTMASRLRDVATAFVEGNLIEGFNQLGTAVRDLGDEIGPQIQEGIQTIADTVTEIDLGQIAVNIAGWVQGRWADLVSFVQNEVLGRIPAINLGTIIAEITGWAITALASIGDKIREIATGDDGDQRHAPGGGINLGTIKATIEAWLIEQKTNLANAINEKVAQAKIALGGLGAKLGSLRATIEQWLVEQALPLATEISTKAKDFAAGVVASIPTVTATIVSWAIEGLGDLAGAVQRAVGGADPAGGGSFRGGPGGIVVTLSNIKATIDSWLAENVNLEALATEIKSKIESVDVDEVKATVMGIAWTVGDAAGTALAELQKQIEDFIPDKMTLPEAISVDASINLTLDWASGLGGGGDFGDLGPFGPALAELTGWFEDTKAKIIEMLKTPLTIPLDAFDIGNDIGLAIGRGIDSAVDLISQKGDEIKSAIIDIGGSVIGGIVLASAAIRGAAVALGAAFVGLLFGIAGVDIDLHKAADGLRESFAEIKSAMDQGLGQLLSGFDATSFGGASREGMLGMPGQAPLSDIFKPLIDSIEQSVSDLVSGLQAIGDTLSGTGNPFHGIITTVQGWIDEMQHSFQNMVFGFSPEGGGSFRGGHGGIAQQFADNIRQMFDGIGPAIEAALPDTNPFQPAIDKITEWWGQLTSFDFGGLRAKDASAAPGTGGEGGAIDAAAIGEQMGTQMAEMLGSDEFVAGVELGLLNVPTEQFSGIAQSFMTKITESLSQALTAGAGQLRGVSEGGPVAGTLAGDMSTMLTGIFTNMVQPLVAAAQALDTGIFAPVGTALMAKIQEGIQSALTTGGVTNTGPTGPAPEAAGTGMGEGIINSIVTSLNSAAQAADFTGISTAFSEKLGTVMQTVATTLTRICCRLLKHSVTERSVLVQRLIR